MLSETGTPPIGSVVDSPNNSLAIYTDPIAAVGGAGSLTSPTALSVQNVSDTSDLEVTHTDSFDLFLSPTLLKSAQSPAQNPVITSNGGGDNATVHVTEGNTFVTDMAITDPQGDTEGDGLYYMINDGEDIDLFNIDAYTGEITFKLTPVWDSPIDQDGDNVYHINVVAFDSDWNADVQFLNVVVDAVPIIISDGEGPTATVHVSEGTTFVTDVQTFDPDGDSEGNGILYDINAGEDASLFDIDTTTGEISFKSAPSWNNPQDHDANNVYRLNVIAFDSDWHADTQFINVVVDYPGTAGPTITSNGGGATANLAIVENNTAVTTVNATGNGISYSLDGGDDAGKFEINASSGQLQFKSTPDYEAPADANGDNIYKVTVKATDTSGATDTQALTVNLTNEVSVFLIGGQSNAVGEGSLNSDLPANLQTPHPDVHIWQEGPSAEFVNLQPGFSGYFGGASDGEGFGLELGFGHNIHGHTDEEVYLIKYALGGTDLAEDWDPQGHNNQHDAFVTRVSAALADLSANNISYDIEGMLWMQGEADSIIPAQANAYESNLTAFIADMRSRYGSTLDFVLGRIHDGMPWHSAGYVDVVRTAQTNVAAADPLTQWLNTDDLSLTDDDVHFDSNGHLNLGYRFADSFI
ncbi:MAG: sialate O-acetylesterase [Cyanobacteria bacterium P01_A01_bin.105]